MVPTRNLTLTSWYGKYTIIYSVLYIPGGWEWDFFQQYHNLGGGNSNIVDICWHVHPENWGFHDPIWRSYFSNGLGKNHQLHQITRGHFSCHLGGIKLDIFRWYGNQLVWFYPKKKVVHWFGFGEYNFMTSVGWVMGSKVTFLVKIWGIFFHKHQHSWISSLTIQDWDGIRWWTWTHLS